MLILRTTAPPCPAPAPRTSGWRLRTVRDGSAPRMPRRRRIAPQSHWITRSRDGRGRRPADWCSYPRCLTGCRTVCTACLPRCLDSSYPLAARRRVPVANRLGVGTKRKRTSRSRAPVEIIVNITNSSTLFRAMQMQSVQSMQTVRLCWGRSR